MTDEAAKPESHAGEEVDPGEPIAMLAGFKHATSGGFLPRVRRAINRRTTVGQLASFVGGAPAVVLRELWLMLNEQLDPRGPRKDDSHGNETP
jgi:hypothetical protein